jgi:hypothetical protein
MSQVPLIFNEAVNVSSAAIERKAMTSRWMRDAALTVYVERRRLEYSTVERFGQSEMTMANHGVIGLPPSQLKPSRSK